MTVNTQELRELLEKATPGPWAVRYDYVVQAPSFDDGRLVPVAQPYGVNSDGTDLFANARLIAAARNALPTLLAENEALSKQVEELREEGAAAVRWAPSSAHWSCELKRLFGDDARQGIDALEKRLRYAQAENDALREALEWYAGMAKRMGNAALHGDSQSILALMKEVAVDYGGRARVALNPPAPPQGETA